jgi:DNA-directed RNA polymerase specialized sigma24 family protein
MEKNGNEKAEENNAQRQANRLNALIHSYAPSLLRYLSSRLGDKNEAQDIAQEAYFRLSRVKDTDLIKKPESYLFRIAVNLASELLLKNSRKAETIDLEALQNINGDGVGDGDGDIFNRQLEACSDVLKIEEIL